MTAARGKHSEPARPAPSAIADPAAPGFVCRGSGDGKESTAASVSRLAAVDGFEDAPFVVRRADAPTDWWAARPTGGYFGGNKTGKAMARMLLRIVRERRAGLPETLLQFMLLDLMAHAAALPAGQIRRSEAVDSLRGQIVGFAAELSRFLMVATAGDAGRLVDTWAAVDLQEMFEAGQFFDEGAYMAELERRDRENGIEDDEPPRARRRRRKASTASAAKV